MVDAPQAVDANKTKEVALKATSFIKAVDCGLTADIAETT
jgi:hypothetical protein